MKNEGMYRAMWMNEDTNRFEPSGKFYGDFDNAADAAEQMAVKFPYRYVEVGKMVNGKLTLEF